MQREADFSLKSFDPIPHTLYPKTGFTLIELMVATSIIGVIGLTILTTFASGFHVYERVQIFGGAQADVLLAFEEMEKDLNNTFPFLSIPIEGDAQSIAFPAVIEIPQLIDGQEKITMSIGRIAYYLEDATFLDDVDKGLIREQQDYSQATSNAKIDLDQSNYVAYIDDLSFEYFYYDEDDQEYGWQAFWGKEEDNVLAGVKIAMTYKDGERDKSIERTVIIPVFQKIINSEEGGEEGQEGEEGGEEG